MSPFESILALSLMLWFVWELTGLVVKVECWWRFRRTRGQIVDRFRP